MQPQQPEASSEPQATPDPSSQPEASEQSATPSQTSSWLQRLWRGRGGRGKEPEPSQEPQEPEQASRLSLTQEELEKRIQAETDRRENKRREAADIERRRKLRDEDPWQYVEEERQAEQRAMSDAQVNNMFSQIGSQHDRVTLDPLVESLPAEERDRILRQQGAGLGLEGRKQIVTEGLKALEKHWKAEGAKDAEEKLRRNPAFRKQVLNEFRRGMTEPEFIGSGAPSAGDRSVSGILRQTMSTHRSI